MTSKLSSLTHRGPLDNPAWKFSRRLARVRTSTALFEENCRPDLSHARQEQLKSAHVTRTQNSVIAVVKARLAVCFSRLEEKSLRQSSFAALEIDRNADDEEEG